MNCPNGHTFTRIDDTQGSCLLCGAVWAIAAPEPPAEPKRGRRGARNAKTTGETAGNPTADLSASLLGSGVQNAGHADQGTLPSGISNVPEAPADSRGAPKTRPRRKAAAPAPEDVEDTRFSEPGPYAGTKCPVVSCVAKLVHHAPNIVANKQITYHYDCPNCHDVRVSAFIGAVFPA